MGLLFQPANTFATEFVRIIANIVKLIITNSSNHISEYSILCHINIFFENTIKNTKFLLIKLLLK